MTEIERIILLEERYAHLQRHTAGQDKAMLELAGEVAQLRKEITRLRGQMATGREPDDGTSERPPHY